MSRRHSERAAIYIEGTFAAALFFTMVFATIDTARLFYSYLIVERAVRAAGRFGLTGQQLKDGEVTLSREASIERTFNQAAGENGVDAGTLCIQPLGEPCQGSHDAGGAGEFFKISAEKTIIFTPLFRMFFRGGHYTIKVGASFRNEAF